MHWSNCVALLLLADIAPEPPVPPEVPPPPVPVPPPLDPVLGLSLPQPVPLAIAGLALCLAVFVTVRGLCRRKQPHRATALALAASSPVLLATCLLVARSHNSWSVWQATLNERTAAFQAQSAEYDRQFELHEEAMRVYEIDRRRGGGGRTYEDEYLLMEPDPDPVAEATSPEAAPAVAPDPDPE